jgi:hypothetical protein
MLLCPDKCKLNCFSAPLYGVIPLRSLKTLDNFPLSVKKPGYAMGTMTGLHSSERFILQTRATPSLGPVRFRFAKVEIDPAACKVRFGENHRRASEITSDLQFIQAHEALRSNPSAFFIVPVDSMRVYGILSHRFRDFIIGVWRFFAEAMSKLLPTVLSSQLCQFPC